MIEKIKKLIGSHVDDAKKKFDEDMDQMYSDGKKDLCSNESPWLLWIVAAAGACFGFMLGILF